MISNLPRTLLCWIFAFCVHAEPDACVNAKPDAYSGEKLALFLQSSGNAETPSVELQLLDVRLGTPYAKTKEHLTEIYGPPKSGKTTTPFDMFLLDKKTESILIITPNERDPTFVGAIQISGTYPIGGLNFFADINLGDPENDIPLKFPRAEADPVLKDGYRHYNIPLSNYSIEAKNGKVASFRIQDEYTMTLKVEGKSISLSKNLTMIAAKQGLLSAPTDIDKLAEFTADSLRPYCQRRYPLRLAAGGKAYIDVNVLKNGAKAPVPAVFLLDTGCSITSISPEFCRKVNCKDLNSPPLEQQDTQPIKTASWGIIRVGSRQFITNEFDVDYSGIFNLEKIDGILGGDVLFAFPLFINFKHAYLCFPSLPIPDVAQALQFKRLPTRHESLVTWVDFHANKQLLQEGILDSGIDTTSLPTKDIVSLKLTKLTGGTSLMKADGIHPTFLYGPVTIGWPALGITQKLNEVTQEPVEKMPLIGTDFLRHYILSLDLKSDVFYLGE